LRAILLVTIFTVLAAAYMPTASVLEMLFLESIPSTSLNGSLRNFNTWRVLVGNRTLRRDFRVFTLPQSKWGPKTTSFRRLRNSKSNLRANIPGKEHDIDNRETAMETMRGFLHRLKISWTLVH